MIRAFADRGTEDVFNGVDTRAARVTCPKLLWSIARRKLDQLNRVRELAELAIPPGNKLERNSDECDSDAGRPAQYTHQQAVSGVLSMGERLCRRS